MHLLNVGLRVKQPARRRYIFQSNADCHYTLPNFIHLLFVHRTWDRVCLTWFPGTLWTDWQPKTCVCCSTVWETSVSRAWLVTRHSTTRVVSIGAPWGVVRSVQCMEVQSMCKNSSCWNQLFCDYKEILSMDWCSTNDDFVPNKIRSGDCKQIWVRFDALVEFRTKISVFKSVLSTLIMDWDILNKLPSYIALTQTTKKNGSFAQHRHY